MSRLLPWLLSTALLLGASACSDDSPGTGAPGSAAPDGCENAEVRVTGTDDLTDALAAARPGTTIRLESGRYDGPFQITRSGTAAQPISLCGPGDAVLDGGPVDSGYALHLDGASYWRLSGFTVTGAQKGVMVDGSSHVELSDLVVEEVGDEGIHLRSGSSHNLVRGNTVQRTGLREPAYGEGIYIGTAESNWCDISDCEPDRSDANRVIDNVVRDTTAEAVDIKEGTTGGELSGNELAGPVSDEADSVVDVKGNAWTVRDNRLRALAVDGVQVHVVVARWGRDNQVVGNSFQLTVAGGLAVNVVGDARGAGNVVGCGQRVEPTRNGELSNVRCH